MRSSRRALVSLLLAFALVAGQWLASAHETDHGLQAGTHGCAVCVYAQGLGSGALPAIPHLDIGPSAERPEVAAAASPLAATVRNHPIRGPPAFLA